MVGGPLDFVDPTANPNVNVFLYGPPKTGKTLAAASAPGPVLYLNADTPSATRMAHATFPGEIKEVKVTGLETFVQAVSAIEANPDLFKTVVLDPINETYRILLEQISGRALSPQINQYGDVGTHLERFCRKLMELPVNVVLVAHETAVKDESSGEFERLPYTGTNNPALGAKLMAAVDVIGYCGVVEGVGDAPNQYAATLVNARGRRGGDRFGVLGKSRETNLTEWIELAGAAAATLAKEGNA